MLRKVSAILACVSLLATLVACDVPAPPPEVPTATPGSQNPESDQSRLSLTPVVPTPERPFEPLNAGPGHIYFVRNSHLWRVEPAGTGAKQLSDLPVDTVPVPSPDGSLISFVSGQDLYVIPATGGTPSKILSGNVVDNQRLGWTPDGATVGCIVADPTVPGAEKAYAVPAKGGEPTLIADLETGPVPRGPRYERSVQWSSDRIWVVVSGQNNPMLLMHWPSSPPREGEPRVISGGEPDFSPDGHTLMYTESLNGAIVIYSPAEDKSTPFLNETVRIGTGFGEYAQGPGPRWSPASNGSDQDLLAYRSRTQQGEPQVLVRERSGDEFGTLPPLTDNPAWSPSGDRLVVETGYVQTDTLGLKWVPDGLAISKADVAGQDSVNSLVRDAQWPAWGK